MKFLAVWEDFEIYTDTIGLVVTLHLAQIEVDDFYGCNGMFRQTSVTKHKLGWEKELTTFSLKDKSSLDLFFFFFSFSKFTISSGPILLTCVLLRDACTTAQFERAPSLKHSGHVDQGESTVLKLANRHHKPIRWNLHLIPIKALRTNSFPSRFVNKTVP